MATAQLTLEQEAEIEACIQFFPEYSTVATAYSGTIAPVCTSPVSTGDCIDPDSGPA